LSKHPASRAGSKKERENMTLQDVVNPNFEVVSPEDNIIRLTVTENGEMIFSAQLDTRSAQRLAMMLLNPDKHTVKLWKAIEAHDAPEG